MFDHSHECFDKYATRSTTCMYYYIDKDVSQSLTKYHARAFCTMYVCIPDPDWYNSTSICTKIRISSEMETCARIN